MRQFARRLCNEFHKHEGSAARRFKRSDNMSVTHWIHLERLSARTFVHRIASMIEDFQIQ